MTCSFKLLKVKGMGVFFLSFFPRWYQYNSGHKGANDLQTCGLVKDLKKVESKYPFCGPCGFT